MQNEGEYRGTHDMVLDRVTRFSEQLGRTTFFDWLDMKKAPPRASFGPIVVFPNLYLAKFKSMPVNQPFYWSSQDVMWCLVHI